MSLLKKRVLIGTRGSNKDGAECDLHCTDALIHHQTDGLPALPLLTRRGRNQGLEIPRRRGNPMCGMWQEC